MHNVITSKNLSLILDYNCLHTSRLQAREQLGAVIAYILLNLIVTQIDFYLDLDVKFFLMTHFETKVKNQTKIQHMNDS
jgi:hypothetical protein